MIVQACLNGSRTIGFHQRLPLTSEDIANDGASCIAAGAAELHLHPRGATGKESLAAVDTTVLSLRRACPGTLLACRQELGSRATKFIPAIASPSGMSCRITPQ